MAVLDNKIKKRLTANLRRHSKCISLVDPHKRGMDGDAFVEPEGQRDLHGFNGVVAAIRVARIVRLAHASNKMTRTASVGQRPRKTEKNQVAARHKGRWQAAIGNLDRGFTGKSGIRNGGERFKLDQMIVVLARFPICIQRGHILAQARANAEFNRMALPVIEAKCLNSRKTLQRPGKTNG
jgi:hypothetical protein